MITSSTKIFLVFLAVPSVVVALQCYCSGVGAQGCTNDGFCNTVATSCTNGMQEACIKLSGDVNGEKRTIKECDCASKVNNGK